MTQKNWPKYDQKGQKDNNNLFSKLKLRYF